MPTSFETNPYLILFASALKPQPKPASGLLDPPQDEAGIRVRWQEVDKLQNDALAPDQYERLHYNGKLGEVKAALLDRGAAERKRHIGEARKEIERRCLASVREYVLGSGKDISKEGIGKVALSLKRWLNADTVEKLAESFGYRIVDNADTKDNPLPTPTKPMDWPDILTRKSGVIEPKIMDCLVFLGTYENRTIQTVYDFLNVPCTSSLATLQKRLSEMEETSEYKVAGRKHYNANKSKQTPHLSAAEKIFKMLYVVLKSDESRKTWERCCALTQIDDFLRPIFNAQITHGPKVSAENYLGAVKKCREKGLSKADAEYYVYEFFVLDKKCPMPQSQHREEAQDEPRFCSVCHAANPHNAKICSKCGMPFDITCPHCGKKAECGDGNCPHCGFAVGDMPLAQPLLKEAKDALAKNDIAEALAKVDLALEYWPKLADAEALQSTIKKRKQELVDIGKGIKAKEEAARAEAEKQTAIKKFNDAVREGRFDEADGQIPGLASKGVVGKDMDALKGKLAVARFDAALAEFRFDNALRLIGDVVRYGADTEANLKARVTTVKNGKLRFVKDSFSEALSKGEIAKAESLLQSLKANGCSERDAAQMQKSLEEKKREIAEARTNELVGKLEKVVSLAAVGSEEGAPEIQVSWEPATTGTPASGWMVKRVSGEQEVVLEKFTVKPRHFDKTAKLGVKYSYVVIPVVAADSGKKDVRENEAAAARSKPVVCLTKLAPNALNGKGQGEQGLWGTAALSWELPPGVDVQSGNVKLLLSRADGEIGNKDVTDKGGRFEDTSVSVGQSHEYKLSMVMAGKPCGTSSVKVKINQMQQPEPVQQLSADRLPVGRWLVKWTWPMGMEQAIVSPVFGGEVREGAQLEATEGARPVMLDTYKSDDGVEVFLPAAASGIAVCTFMDRPGGGRIYSSLKTVPAVARQTVVHYGFVQKSGGLFRKASPPTAVIWSDSAALPDLVLVEGRNGRPARKEAGKVVATIQARCSSAPMVIAVGESARTDCMKLFLSNPERDAAMFKIELPVQVPKNLSC